MVKLLSLADLFTIINLVFGFLAIIVASNMRLAVSLVLLAVLSDGLDGILARRGRNGVLGEYMDVGADLVSFCIAPNIILYNNIVFPRFYVEIVVLICSVVFVVSGFIRLTSFPVMKNQKFFLGLPTPAAGLILSLLIFVKASVFYIIPVLILLSLLMLVNVRFPKMDVKTSLFAAVLIILVIIFDGFWYNLMAFVLLVSLTFYILWGFVLTFKK